MTWFEVKYFGEAGVRNSHFRSIGPGPLLTAWDPGADPEGGWSEAASYFIFTDFPISTSRDSALHNYPAFSRHKKLKGYYYNFRKVSAVTGSMFILHTYDK